MTTLSDIKKPVKSEMAEFEVFFNKVMQSEVPFVRLLLNHILRKKGKQMRPLLVFLTASLNGEINESTYVAASLIELLHTATLVHDDVVDDARERRGIPTINAIWNSKIAVLIGDFLLAQGLLISVNNKTYRMLATTSDAVQEMISGELIQMQKTRSLNIKEDDYYKVIRKKTAALISACTTCGAISSTGDETAISRMKEFGNAVGIAFQIKDDLLDYNSNGLTGKKEGNDIKEKKITLPLIYALEKATLIEKRKIIRTIRKKNKSRQDIRSVIDFVKKYKGLEYAEQAMACYRSKALDLLSVYPDSDVKESLIKFVLYTTEREK
jgi:octaprenyl-diphosphate synthase